MLTFVLIGCCGYFGLGFTTLNRNALYVKPQNYSKPPCGSNDSGTSREWTSSGPDKMSAEERCPLMGGTKSVRFICV